MQKIKKAFQPIINLLEANTQALVSDVMQDVLKLAEAAKGGGGGATTSIRHPADNSVHAIFCYYHKQWELVSEVEFGSKTSSSTGLNSMCKEGAAAWTRQNTEAKKASAALLPLVMDGSLLVEDIPNEQNAIEEARSVITPREDGHGTSEAPSFAQVDPASSLHNELTDPVEGSSSRVA